MKKTIISLLAAFAVVLCAVLMTAPQAQAADEHVCSDHSGWTKLTNAGGSLAAGNYYLDGDITLQNTITLPAGNVKICLNGHTLTAPNGQRAIVTGSASGQLHIYDHTGKTSGTIQGKSLQTNGATIAITKASYTFYLHSGTIQGGEATGSSNGWGGNIFINNATATMHMYGGKIQDGQAERRGGNISVHQGNLIVEGGAIVNGGGTCGNNIQFSDSGYMNGTKRLDSLDKAGVTIDGIVHVGNWNDDKANRVEFFKLYSDIPSTYSVAFGTQDRYIDLNGFDFQGSLTGATTSQTVYLLDSGTKSYNAADAGKYFHNITDSNATVTCNTSFAANLGNISDNHYLTVQNSDNSYSAHYFSYTINTVSIELTEEKNVNIGYGAEVRGDAVVAEAMQGTAKIGMSVYLREEAALSSEKEIDNFQAGSGYTFSLRLKNVMTATGTNNAAKAMADIKAKVKLTVNGITFESAEYAVSFKEIMEAADKKLNDAQMPADARALLLEIYEQYYADIKSWDIPNIKEEKGIQRISAQDEQKLREQVVKYMQQMCEVEYTLSSDYQYTDTSNNNTVVTKTAGTAVRGQPYSHKAASLEKILSRIDSNGKLVLKSGETLDNVGNDCADAGFWAWSQISAEITFTITNDTMCNNGTYPVGGYDITGIPADRTSSASVDGSKWVCNKNGTAAMYAAYAQLKMGDAVLLSPGHFRMVSANAVVVYKQDGSIDGDNSYILTHEQGGYRYTGPWSSCSLNKQYSFATLYSTGYVPLTIKAFEEGADTEQVYVCNGKEATLTEMVASGYVVSNYRINYITLTVKDSTGAVVGQEQNFTFHGGSNNTTQVSLSIFTDLVNGLSLTSGAEYTYQIDVHVGDATLTGQTVTFTA